MEYIILAILFLVPACFLLNLLCFILGFTKVGDTAERKQDAKQRITL